MSANVTPCRRWRNHAMCKRGCFWLCWLAVLLAFEPMLSQAGAAAPGINERFELAGHYSQVVELSEGQTVEVSVGVESPAKLPPNGRIAIEWSGPAADSGFRKVLHALDPDVYV